MFAEVIYVQQQACANGQCPPVVQVPQVTVALPALPLPVVETQAVVQVRVRKRFKLFGGCGLFGGGCR